jgi:hypothetical protein
MLSFFEKNRIGLKESTTKISTLYVLEPCDPQFRGEGEGGLVQLTDLINIAS